MSASDDAARKTATVAFDAAKAKEKVQEEERGKTANVWSPFAEDVAEPSKSRPVASFPPSEATSGVHRLLPNGSVFEQDMRWKDAYSWTRPLVDDGGLLVGPHNKIFAGPPCLSRSTPAGSSLRLDSGAGFGFDSSKGSALEASSAAPLGDRATTFFGVPFDHSNNKTGVPHDADDYSLRGDRLG